MKLTSPYDPTNIFGRILQGEILCRKVYEDIYALAFHDIQPKAPIHVLVIPKGPYLSLLDFTEKAPPEVQLGFWNAVRSVARQESLEEKGFRLISNCGLNGGQEVPHFHVHLLGGKLLGKMV
ncbi:MAG: histidine triad nucleotide-binding protein [Alphaproteobacteria bacterium]